MYLSLGITWGKPELTIFVGYNRNNNRDCGRATKTGSLPRRPIALAPSPRRRGSDWMQRWCHRFSSVKARQPVGL